MNKRAMEWPSFLISSILSMLLFIIGVLMVIDIAKLEGPVFDYEISALSFKEYSARALNSADCLAWEEQTPSGYLVHAGIIDVGKLRSDALATCLSGTKYFVKVSYDTETQKGITEEKSNGMILTNDVPYIGTSRASHNSYDWFAVKVYDGGALYDGIAVVAIA